MPIHPRESDPAVPDPAGQAPESAVRSPGGELPPSGPPDGPGSDTDEGPGPDASRGGSAPSEEEQHTAELRELEDRWRRALADLDNLRKRHARELERERTEVVEVGERTPPAVLEFPDRKSTRLNSSHVKIS